MGHGALRPQSDVVATRAPGLQQHRHEHRSRYDGNANHACPRGFAPRAPLHALSRAASTARSPRVARSRGSLAGPPPLRPRLRPSGSRATLRPLAPSRYRRARSPRRVARTRGARARPCRSRSVRAASPLGAPLHALLSRPPGFAPRAPGRPSAFARRRYARALCPTPSARSGAPAGAPAIPAPFACARSRRSLAFLLHTAGADAGHHLEVADNIMRSRRGGGQRARSVGPSQHDGAVLEPKAIQLQRAMSASDLCGPLGT